MCASVFAASNDDVSFIDLDVVNTKMNMDTRSIASSVKKNAFLWGVMFIL